MMNYIDTYKLRFVSGYLPFSNGPINAERIGN